jgi:hypothetical protein
MRAFLRRNWPALTLVTLGLAFSAIGVWRGEAAVVLRKAIFICMECIGLG